jgi:two-component system LytT family response regulator
MNARMQVLIVDDEPLARANLRVLLARDPDVAVVGECASGRSALQWLRERSADLVFLDVQMTRLSGLDVIRELGPDAMPLVVFATAYDRYALDAFEAEALDYLLKPFDDARFTVALERAKTRWRNDRQASLGRRLQALLDGLDGAGRPGDAAAAPSHASGAAPGAARRDRILVRRHGRIVPVEAAGIDWVEAADYCVRLHVGRERYVLRKSMAEMERRLDDEHFLRVHRSAIVRLDLVDEVRSGPGVSWLALRDGTRIPLSRRRRLLLEQRLRS